MGCEWCSPGTARGGETSVYGTGAALPPERPVLEAGPVGALGAGPVGALGGGAEPGFWGRGGAARGQSREALD